MASHSEGDIDQRLQLVLDIVPHLRNNVEEESAIRKHLQKYNSLEYTTNAVLEGRLRVTSLSNNDTDIANDNANPPIRCSSSSLFDFASDTEEWEENVDNNADVQELCGNRKARSCSDDDLEFLPEAPIPLSALGGRKNLGSSTRSTILSTSSPSSRDGVPAVRCTSYRISNEFDDDEPSNPSSPRHSGMVDNGINDIKEGDGFETSPLKLQRTKKRKTKPIEKEESVKRRKEELAAKDEAKEKAKQQRREERLQRKKEKEKEISEKRSARERNRKRTLPEAMKELYVLVESSLFNNPIGSEIQTHLCGRCAGVKSLPLSPPGAIVLRRSVPLSRMSDALNRHLSSSNTGQEVLAHGRASGELQQLEPFVILLWSPEDLCRYIDAHASDGGRMLRFHDEVQHHHSGKEVIVILYNVRAYLVSPDKQRACGVPAFAFESALLELRMRHSVKVMEYGTIQKATECFICLVESIAMDPYKDRDPFEDDFCAVSTRPGKHTSTREVFAAQLNMIPGVSEAMASAIAERYGSFARLMKVYRSPDTSTKDKESMLEGMVSIALTERRIGKTVSKRIYDYFNADDGEIVLQ